VSNPRLLWQSLEVLARAEAAQGNQQIAADYWSRAEQAIQGIAVGLQDHDLRRMFIKAGPVQRVLQSAKQG
jgi:hypothetical protein